MISIHKGHTSLRERGDETHTRRHRGKRYAQTRKCGGFFSSTPPLEEEWDVSGERESLMVKFEEMIEGSQGIAITDTQRLV